MVFREVSVIEIREVLRAWLAGKSERAVAAQAGVDRKTSRRYVTAAMKGSRCSLSSHQITNSEDAGALGPWAIRVR